MIKIQCKRNRSDLDFFLTDDAREYYLFTQRWNRGVEEYFKNGVMLNKARDHSNGGSDIKIHKAKAKLPMYIRFIEKESGMVFLEQSKRRSERAA